MIDNDRGFNLEWDFSEDITFELRSKIQINKTNSQTLANKTAMRKSWSRESKYKASEVGMSLLGQRTGKNSSVVMVGSQQGNA